MGCRIGFYEFDFLTSLRVDAMYLHSARLALDRGASHTDGINEATQQFKELKEREGRINEQHCDDEGEAEVVLESIAIQMVEHVHPILEEAYSKCIHEWAAVHIFCAAALEAHINSRAQALLSGKLYEEFDKLSLEGKWLVLPRLAGRETFDPGSQPYQSFAKLVRFRNRLLHHKQRPEPHQIGSAAPETLLRLGLNFESGKASLDAAIRMIKRLAELLKEPHPDWVIKNPENFFLYEIKKTPIPQ